MLDGCTKIPLGTLQTPETDIVILILQIRNKDLHRFNDLLRFTDLGMRSKFQRIHKQLFPLNHIS